MSMSCYAMSCECGVSVRTCGTVLRRQLPWLSALNRGCAFNPLKRSAPRRDHPRTVRPRAVTAPLALHRQGFRVDFLQNVPVLSMHFQEAHNAPSERTRKDLSNGARLPGNGFDGQNLSFQLTHSWRRAIDAARHSPHERA